MRRPRRRSAGANREAKFDAAWGEGGVVEIAAGADRQVVDPSVGFASGSSVVEGMFAHGMAKEGHRPRRDLPPVVELLEAARSQRMVSPRVGGMIGGDALSRHQAAATAGTVLSEGGAERHGNPGPAGISEARRIGATAGTKACKVLNYTDGLGKVGVRPGQLHGLAGEGNTPSAVAFRTSSPLAART